jgi:hypothetical protein
MRNRNNPMSDFDYIDFRMRFRSPKEAIVALLTRIEDKLVYGTVRARIRVRVNVVGLGLGWH